LASNPHALCSCANPSLPPVPFRVHSAEQHHAGATRLIPFDLSADLGLSYAATSPNLLAGFIRLCAGEALSSSAVATSSVFYALHGRGSTEFGGSRLSWAEGDLFTVPGALGCEHVADAAGAAALYYVHDAPLLRYLGCVPSEARFVASLFRAADLRAAVARLAEEGGVHKNRLGVLLGTSATEGGTMTLTHTLWSLLNLLPKRSAQPPHRHNSVALDLCVFAPPSGCYTLMGPELDESGWVKDPVRAEWGSGAVFTTPPGWWHSHHNERDEDAWVLPVQDAGLYTHQRTLDIRFSIGLPRGPSAEDLSNAAAL